MNGAVEGVFEPAIESVQVPLAPQLTLSFHPRIRVIRLLPLPVGQA